jgi:hypothetical protein
MFSRECTTQKCLVIYNFDSIIEFLVQKPIDQKIQCLDSFTNEVLIQLNFINLNFLQEVVEGFFSFSTFIRTN